MGQLILTFNFKSLYTCRVIHFTWNEPIVQLFIDAANYSKNNSSIISSAIDTASVSNYLKGLSQNPP